MDQLVTEVLATLQTAEENGILDDHVDEAILLTGELLRKVQIPRYHSGLPEVDAAEVAETEGRELEEALLRLLRKYPQSWLVGNLIQALGQKSGRAHVEEFTAHLERGARMLVEGNRLVHAALYSLDKAGEDVFEWDSDGSSSQGLIDVEKNLRQARAYLAKRDIQVPW